RHKTKHTAINSSPPQNISLTPQKHNKLNTCDSKFNSEYNNGGTSNRDAIARRSFSTTIRHQTSERTSSLFLQSQILFWTSPDNRQSGEKEACLQICRRG